MKTLKILTIASLFMFGVYGCGELEKKDIKTDSLKVQIPTTVTCHTVTTNTKCPNCKCDTCKCDTFKCDTVVKK